MSSHGTGSDGRFVPPRRDQTAFDNLATESRARSAAGTNPIMILAREPARPGWPWPLCSYGRTGITLIRAQVHGIDCLRVPRIGRRRVPPAQHYGVV